MRSLRPLSAPAPRARGCRPRSGEPTSPRVSATPRYIVGIASSTGGPRALLEIFSRLPERFPGAIVIAQHMPDKFTRTFAERLDKKGAVRVVEAQDGDAVTARRGYVCPGKQSMELVERERRPQRSPRPRRRPVPTDRYCPERRSLACGASRRSGGSRAIGVILTGMGDDGVAGARAIRAAGGMVIAESEETAVVYGMPGAAVRAGVASDVLPLPALGDYLAGLGSTVSVRKPRFSRAPGPPPSFYLGGETAVYSLRRCRPYRRNGTFSTPCDWSTYRARPNELRFPTDHGGAPRDTSRRPTPRGRSLRSISEAGLKSETMALTDVPILLHVLDRRIRLYLDPLRHARVSAELATIGAQLPSGRTRTVVVKIELDISEARRVAKEVVRGRRGAELHRPQGRHHRQRAGAQHRALHARRHHRGRRRPRQARALLGDRHRQRPGDLEPGTRSCPAVTRAAPAWAAG